MKEIEQIEREKRVFECVKKYYKDFDSLCSRLQNSDSGFVISDQDINALAILLDVYDGLDIEL